MILLNAPILTIHGAGQHGRVVAEAASLAGYMINITDDRVGTSPTLFDPCIIAIGDNKNRAKFHRYNLVSIIHASASVSSLSVLLSGSYVGPMGVIGTSAHIGRGSIINSGAIVEHDCIVGAYSHVAPGAVLCGSVTLGEGCFIGANAVVREGIVIAPWTVVGCGAVVVENITQPGTYVGVPARLLRGE